ncbi:MAG: hypothetical protein KJ634_12560 [Gammaproteobacteria bacterium]|nr:hypothetical protein [Gammaproteobacteria bacterium]MBU1416446.1 hypothetical protein [Gammaproteobacteria bacterium]
MLGSPDLGPMTEISSRGPVNSTAERVLRWTWQVGLGLLTCVLLVLGWLVSTGSLYEAGDDLGYNMGLVGGLLMLSLLLYPVRKRARFMNRLGSMQAWFRYHQVAGIVGPLLVLFHSTFRIGSMNGRVALYAMILVAASGLVGRFLYRHIHRGMYGRHLTMRDAEEDLKAGTEDIHNVFAAYPKIHSKLMDFRTYAFAHEPSHWRRMLRFMTLRSRGHRLSLSIHAYMKKALSKAKHENRLTRTQRILAYQLAKQKTDLFVETVCEAAQLSSWERLFSLWHVLHVPFLYLLVISGIVHVVAVHMY